MEESQRPKMEMDLMFMSASGEFVDQPLCKAMLLTVVSKECGSMACTQLLSKDHRHAPAFIKQFVDSHGYDEIDLKSDNEVTMPYLAERVKLLRSPLKTNTLTTAINAHEELGACERAHGTVQD